jgi:hypothetical protein
VRVHSDNEPKISRLTFSPEFPSRTIKARYVIRSAEVTRHRVFGTEPYFTRFGVELASLVVDIFQIG